MDYLGRVPRIANRKGGGRITAYFSGSIVVGVPFNGWFVREKCHFQMDDI